MGCQQGQGPPVQLRLDVKGSPSLPERVRARLMALAGRRLTRNGVLVITAQRFRTQERSRADALERLVELIARAAEPERPRQPRRARRAPQGSAAWRRRPAWGHRRRCGKASGAD
ncbi:MAG: hypothetical protein U1E17_09235 [Geminicoccaceae bacterium]